MKHTLVMRRIIGLEPKNRVSIQAYVESELLEIMRERKIERQNIINIGVEKELIERGYIIIEPEETTSRLTPS